MASILVVCSGNICRSPIAEGLLRRAIGRRLGDDAPVVSSAGTIAMDGAPASEGSVIASAELGVDIRAHSARHLTDALIEEADLCLCMAGEHRDEIVDRIPPRVDHTFTLKELVRLLEVAPPVSDAGLDERLEAAAAARSAGVATNAFDEDVADPLGMPLETYRAVAWELDAWTERLAAGLFGSVPAPAEGR
jgi:protein-tyrosine phosphatase